MSDVPATDDEAAFRAICLDNIDIPTEYECDYQNVLLTLEHDTVLSSFLREYVGLHHSFVQSHEGERRLLRRCRDLENDLQVCAGKLATAGELAASDGALTQKLHREYTAVQRKGEHTALHVQSLRRHVRELQEELHRMQTTKPARPNHLTQQEGALRALRRLHDDATAAKERQREKLRVAQTAWESAQISHQAALDKKRRAEQTVQELSRARELVGVATRNAQQRSACAQAALQHRRADYAALNLAAAQRTQTLRELESKSGANGVARRQMKAANAALAATAEALRRHVHHTNAALQRRNEENDRLQRRVREQEGVLREWTERAQQGMLPYTSVFDAGSGNRHRAPRDSVGGDTTTRRRVSADGSATEDGHATAHHTAAANGDAGGQDGGTPHSLSMDAHLSRPPRDRREAEDVLLQQKWTKLHKRRALAQSAVCAAQAALDTATAHTQDRRQRRDALRVQRGDVEAEARALQSDHHAGSDALAQAAHWFTVKRTQCEHAEAALGRCEETLRERSMRAEEVALEVAALERRRERVYAALALARQGLQQWEQQAEQENSAHRRVRRRNDAGGNTSSNTAHDGTGSADGAPSPNRDADSGEVSRSSRPSHSHGRAACHDDKSRTDECGARDGTTLHDLHQLAHAQQLTFTSASADVHSLHRRHETLLRELRHSALALTTLRTRLRGAQATRQRHCQEDVIARATLTQWHRRLRHRQQSLHQLAHSALQRSRKVQQAQRELAALRDLCQSASLAWSQHSAVQLPSAVRAAHVMATAVEQNTARFRQRHEKARSLALQLQQASLRWRAGHTQVQTLYSALAKCAARCSTLHKRAAALPALRLRVNGVAKVLAGVRATVAALRSEAGRVVNVHPAHDVLTWVDTPDDATQKDDRSNRKDKDSAAHMEEDDAYEDVNEDAAYTQSESDEEEGNTSATNQNNNTTSTRRGTRSREEPRSVAGWARRENELRRRLQRRRLALQRADRSIGERESAYLRARGTLASQPGVSAVAELAAAQAQLTKRGHELTLLQHSLADFRAQTESYRAEYDTLRDKLAELARSYAAQRNREPSSTMSRIATQSPSPATLPVQHDAATSGGGGGCATERRDGEVREEWEDVEEYVGYTAPAWTPPSKLS